MPGVSAVHSSTSVFVFPTFFTDALCCASKEIVKCSTPGIAFVIIPREHHVLAGQLQILLTSTILRASRRLHRVLRYRPCPLGNLIRGDGKFSGKNTLSKPEPFQKQMSALRSSNLAPADWHETHTPRAWSQATIPKPPGRRRTDRCRSHHAT